LKDTKPKNNKLSSSSTNVIENSNKQHEKLTQKLSKFVKEEQNEDNHFVPEKCSYKEIFET